MESQSQFLISGISNLNKTIERKYFQITLDAKYIHNLFTMVPFNPLSSLETYPFNFVFCLSCINLLLRRNAIENCRKEVDTLISVIIDKGIKRVSLKIGHVTF